MITKCYNICIAHANLISAHRLVKYITKVSHGCTSKEISPAQERVHTLPTQLATVIIITGKDIVHFH